MRNKLFIILAVFMVGFSLHAQTLHIYGGRNHKVYLGCLTCGEHDASSIWNSRTYGNKSNANSIWNEHGSYGSDQSNLSPWSVNASHPPVIVDKSGKFYGYLTLNKSHRRRANLEPAVTMYKYYDMIRNDVSAWHKKIFEEE
jgi:hypothetical protein